MNLLIFLIIPLATILLSIVFQKVLRNPVLVAITFFAVYLVIAFIFFTDTLAEAIIGTIIYTILSYLTALIFRIICKFKRYIREEDDRHLQLENTNSINEILNTNVERRGFCGCNNNNGNSNNDLLTIDCNCGNGGSSNLLTVSSNCLNNNETRYVENDMENEYNSKMIDYRKNNENIEIPSMNNMQYQYNMRKRFRR